MKILKIKYLIIAASFLVIAVSSCKKDDFNINQNTNNPTDSSVTYDVVLPAALDATGRIVSDDWGWLQNWMGYWSRSGTYAPNVSEETYTLTSNTGFGSSLWNDLYSNLYNYQVIQRKATQSGALFYEGIARIMKAHDFQIMVDVFNNVPYSQALNGSGNPTPKYDNALDIYKDLLVQIDSGKAQIARATASQSKNVDIYDIMYGTTRYPKPANLTTEQYINDLMKPRWLSFANTLKLRLLVHLMNGSTATTYVPGIDVQSQVVALFSDPSGFISEDAVVNPGYRTDKPNPFWSSYFQDATSTSVANSQYYRANSYALGYYTADGDPRKAKFYTAAPDKGVAYGLASSTDNAYSKLSGIGPGLLKSADQGQWILTVTESKFLQAEVQERVTPGSALSSLTDAITESFTYLNATTIANPTPSLAAGAYISGNAGYPDVDYAAVPLGPGLPAGGLYTILQQKWFALNGIAPYEVWTDFRRTDIVYGKGGGYTAPAPYTTDGPPISVAQANTATKVPTRLFYPQTEYNYNPANVLSQGTIDRYGKVFWDLQ